MPRRPPSPPRLPEQPQFAKARRALARRDPVLKQLIAQVGPCTLWYATDHFAALVRSIVSQQISTLAARSIHARLVTTLGNLGVTPAGLLAVSDEALRASGLSANKVRAVRDLAEKVAGGVVPLDRLHEMDDEAVVDALIPVRGIGVWTAQMLLIFSLGRLDVLPVGDLGLRANAQKQYGLLEMPDKKVLEALAEPWRPYRSVATWYLWRSGGFVPQSQPE